MTAKQIGERDQRGLRFEQIAATGERRGQDAAQLVEPTAPTELVGENARRVRMTVPDQVPSEPNPEQPHPADQMPALLRRETAGGVRIDEAVGRREQPLGAVVLERREPAKPRYSASVSEAAASASRPAIGTTVWQ